MLEPEPNRDIGIIENSAEARTACGWGYGGEVSILTETHLHALRNGFCLAFSDGEYSHFLVMEAVAARPNEGGEVSEILVPESPRARKSADIDYAITRLDTRIRHNRNECGDILLTNEAVMHIGLDALRYAKARIEVLEKALWEIDLRIVPDIGDYQIVRPADDDLAAKQKEETP